MAKGFVVSHQRISISVGLNGSIQGLTDITITPTEPDLVTVWLHARYLSVKQAHLVLYPSDDRSQEPEKKQQHVVPLPFSYSSSTMPPPQDLTENMHTYPAYKRALYQSINEAEEGELGISVPADAIRKAPPLSGEEDSSKVEYEPIVLRLRYEISKSSVHRNPGLVVIEPDENDSGHFPQVFTSSASSVAARSWVPCLDSLTERCTWDLEIIVPRFLYASHNPASSSYDEAWPLTAVASGELIEQVVHPDRTDSIIWHFSQAAPVSVQQIAWAVGPFVVTEITATTKHRRAGEDYDDATDDSGPKLHALCLPGKELEMENCVGIVRQAMEFYSAQYGSYPFSTYTVAFVDALASGAGVFHSAALTLFGSDVLHPPTVIDPAYETRHLLAHALAYQWSGISIIPKAPSDTWLVVGIALHITALFLRTVWGTNEFRFRLKKDIIRCVGLDIQQEPLSVPARTTYPDSEQLQFIALKAPLVLHTLNKLLRASGTSLGLDKVYPKLFLDAITGELGMSSKEREGGPAKGDVPVYNAISTGTFMKMCRRLCGVPSDTVRTFFDQWVYGSGCPTFLISTVFNRKRMEIEFTVKQECFAYSWAQNAPWEETCHLRPTPFFEGQMMIRIHEADGTPYEHVLNIQDSFQRHEVHFNTKYKRVRRYTKRYQEKQATAKQAALGILEPAEDLNMIDVGFAFPLWEDEEERAKWRVADWNDDDDARMSQEIYEWIRIDAEMEWICGVQFEQPDFMWISQLQRDRDVVAQLEAVHALSRLPSPVVSSNLTRTVLVSSYFVRIRMEAALALTACATEEHDYHGLFHLFKIFQSRYCFEPDELTLDPFRFRCIPKSNDFSDFSEYFLKKAIIAAIAMVRDERGQAPAVVQQFLVELLAYNDNEGNPYADGYYITALINALGSAFVLLRETSVFGATPAFDAQSPNLALAVSAVDRSLTTDRLVPSFRNAITIAGIEWKAKLMLAGLVPADLHFFIAYTRDGLYPPVRIAAFDALLLLNALTDVIALVRYFFAVLASDSSRLVQRALADSILHSLPVLVGVRDLAAGVDASDAGGDRARENLGLIMKALRKKPGRSVNFRQCLVETILNPDVDDQVRLCALKICEATVRPDNEPLPKMRFKVAVSGAVGDVHPDGAPATGYAVADAAPGRALPESEPVASGVNGTNGVAPPAAHADEADASRRAKPRAQPQFQASGMSMSDLASCRSVLKKLFRDKTSVLFRTPVDPVKSGAPGYFDIIKRPMDLSTINAKLSAGQYADRSAFRDDFKLVIENARVYNVQGIVVDLANKLNASFDKLWSKVESTLRGMELARPAPAAVESTAPPARSAAPRTSTAPPPRPPPRQSYAEDPIKERRPKPRPSEQRLSLAPVAPVPQRPEVLNLPPLPLPTTFFSPTDAVDVKKALTVINKLQGMHEAFFFLQPVDPVGPLATYYDEIKHPMDLQTMKNKLVAGKYENYAQLFHDFDLIVANCQQFNTPDTEPIWYVLVLERAWRGEWEKASRLSYNVKRSLLSLVKNLMKEGSAYPFLEPVENIIAQIPTYTNVVPRENARDLLMLKRNLETDVYPDIESFEADFTLMINNCFLFNPPESHVVKSGEALLKMFRNGVSKIKTEQNKKRSSLGGALGTNAKKVKK